LRKAVFGEWVGPKASALVDEAVRASRCGHPS
jgi:hypothetical protein